MIDQITLGAMTPIMKIALEKGGFFYSTGYRNYVSAQGNMPTYLYDSDFMLMVVLKKKAVFRFADLPVEYVQYSEAESPDARKFLDACMAYLKEKQKLHWVNQPYSSARFQEAPAECLKIPYGNHLIDVTQDEGAIWDAFETANRNRIRKAEKSNVEVRFGDLELLDDFYQLDVHTRERSGLAPLDKSFYEEQFHYFPDQIQVVVAYFKDKPQGASFSYCDGHSCYYMYGASTEKSESGSINLMVWRMLQKTKALNMQMFSFVGARINPDPDSKFYGINRFKTRFAAEVETCYLFKVIFNIPMYKVYDRIKRLNQSIRKYPYVVDIIDQEISKWTDMNDQDLLKSVYGNKLLLATSFKEILS
jgi:hypothetical protein